jgi:glycine cleavage system H lipoate-binding protein
MCLPEFTRDFWFEPLPAASPDVSAGALRPVRMGLSVDAVDAMPGRWVGIELPGRGEVIRARDGFGFVTTEHTTHDLRSPSAFRVVAVNERVIANAEIARLSSRVEGWLLEIEPMEAQATV